jgi:ABC-type phosphate transport system substrate-binding protein
MTFLSARRAISASIIAAGAVAAFVVPSAASAALPGHCLGTSTEGAGSSLQAEAQAVWDPGFSASKAGCTTGPTVTYHSIGSGAGYKEWAVEKHFGTVGFVGTDNTVNLAEKEVVEKEVETGSSELLTVPVLQGAVTVSVNLPENCTATSTQAAGRLALNQPMLEKIYSVGATWKEVAEQEGAGNSITGAGCNLEVPVKAIVRKDGSGTTHIFKKFLDLTSSALMASEDGKEHSWGELAEGSLSTKWPTAAKVVIPTETTGTGVLKEVAKTPGSIGYANLADARNAANGGFTGQSPQRFWVELENSRKEKTTSKGLKITRKYKDPATNGDVAATAESNCKKTEYANEKGSFPPPTVDSAWNEVSAKQFSKGYALCGLTYDLVLQNYTAFAGGTAAEAQTVKDMIGYETSKKGGAKDIKAHDYSALPKTLNASAEEGVAKIED